VRAGCQDECIQDAHVLKMSCFPYKKGDNVIATNLAADVRVKELSAFRSLSRQLRMTEFIPRSKKQSKRKFQQDSNEDRSFEASSDLGVKLEGEDESVFQVLQSSEKGSTPQSKRKRDSKMNLNQYAHSRAIQGETKHGGWVDCLLSSIEQHFVMLLKPSFWNSTELLASRKILTSMLHQRKSTTHCMLLLQS
jgi:hypothetical protein